MSVTQSHVRKFYGPLPPAQYRFPSHERDQIANALREYYFELTSGAAQLLAQHLAHVAHLNPRMCAHDAVEGIGEDMQLSLPAYDEEDVVALGGALPKWLRRLASKGVKAAKKGAKSLAKDAIEKGRKAAMESSNPKFRKAAKLFDAAKLRAEKSKGRKEAEKAKRDLERAARLEDDAAYDEGAEFGDDEEDMELGDLLDGAGARKRRPARGKAAVSRNARKPGRARRGASLLEAMRA